MRFLIAVLLVGETACCAFAASLSVEAVYTRPQPRSEDEVRVHFLLRNSIFEPYGIREVRLSGETVWTPFPEEAVRGERARWCQVWPKSLKAGEWTEVKLLASRSHLQDTTAEIVCEIADATQSVVIEIPEHVSPLEWRGITFSDERRMLWFGLVTEGTTATGLTSVLLNGKERIQDAQPQDPKLAPGKTLVVGIPLGDGRPRGENVFLVCRTEQGDCAAARVRVDDEFPLYTEFGDPPKGLGLDEDHHDYECLMICPTHAHGTNEEAALKLSRIYAEHWGSQQEKFGYVFPCKAGQEEGLAFFSCLADTVVTNPTESVPEEKASGGETSSSRIADLASRSACPAPWIALIATGSDERIAHQKDRSPTHEEVHHLVWECIGNGAKGLLYRGNGEADFRAADIGSINREIRSFLPHLRYAIPVERGQIAGGKAQAAVLQAGFEELIVVITNNTMSYSDEPKRPTFVELLRGLEIQVQIPLGVEIDADRKDCKKVDIDAASGTCWFRVNYLRHVEVARIGLRKAAR